MRLALAMLKSKKRRQRLVRWPSWIYVGALFVFLSLNTYSTGVVSFGIYDSYSGDDRNFFAFMELCFGIMFVLYGIVGDRLFGKEYTGETLCICPKCEEVYEYRKEEDRYCEQCKVKLEGLKSFYSVKRNEAHDQNKHDDVDQILRTDCAAFVRISNGQDWST